MLLADHCLVAAPLGGCRRACGPAATGQRSLRNRTASRLANRMEGRVAAGRGALFARTRRADGDRPRHVEAGRRPRGAQRHRSTSRARCWRFYRRSRPTARSTRRAAVRSSRRRDPTVGPAARRLRRLLGREAQGARGGAAQRAARTGRQRPNRRRLLEDHARRLPRHEDPRPARAAGGERNQTPRRSCRRC